MVLTSQCLELVVKEKEVRYAMQHLKNCVIQTTKRVEDRTEAYNQAQILTNSNNNPNVARDIILGEAGK